MYWLQKTALQSYISKVPEVTFGDNSKIAAPIELKLAQRASAPPITLLTAFCRYGTYMRCRVKL